MHCRCRTLALTVLFLLPGTAFAGPIAISGNSANFCPGGVIPQSLSICVSGFGFNSGVGVQTETSFPGGTGSGSDHSAGSTASRDLDVSSTLGLVSWDMLAAKTGQATFGAAVTSGRVHWRDTVTIDADGLTGQTGKFRASILLSQNAILDGQLNAGLSINSAASFQADTTVNGSGWRFTGTEGFAESTAGGFEDRTSGDSPGVLVTGDLFFVFGTAFTLDVELTQGLNVGANGPTPVASGAATGSARWLGIPEVRLASDGQLVANFNLSSATGTDWSVAAVPSPGASVLLLAGAALLVVRRRA